METVADIAFDDLLQELRREGFALTPDDYIEFTAIFREFQGTREEFKYYLAPVICRNREEQVKFYKIYDQYSSMPGRLERVHPRAHFNRGAQPTLDFINNFNRYAAKRYYFWILMLLVISVSIRLVREYYHQSHLIPALHAAVTDTLEKDPSLVPTAHQHIFVVKALKGSKKTGHGADSADSAAEEEHSRLIPNGAPVEKENSIHSSAFARLLILGFAFLALSVSFFPLRRSNLLPNLDVDQLKGDEAPIGIPFYPKDHLIQSLPAMSRIARDLVQPKPTEIWRLDVGRTITETIRNEGLLTPVHENIHRRPEYLLLIDRSDPVLAHTLRHLARTLAGLSVPLDYYFYDDDDTYYAEDAISPINGYKLRQRHGDALSIFPGSTLSIDPHDPTANPLSGLLDFGPALSLNNPDLLREYLQDDDLFQWVCALAIYPNIRWEVLLSIGAAILEQRNALHKLNLANLLKLARIGWLKNDAISPDLRLSLLRELGLREELVTRKAILELLQESDSLLTEGAFAHPQAVQLLYTQSFVLYAYDVRTYKHYADDARKFISLLDRRSVSDLATVLYLQNKEAKWKTPLRSPDNLEQSVSSNRFINELLALHVIHNPRLRNIFRNAAYTCFAVLCLLFLFKDSIQPTGVNRALDLVDHDYPLKPGPLTVRIPVNDCLKNMLGLSTGATGTGRPSAEPSGTRLLVTLNNYDNNTYSQLLETDGKGPLTKNTLTKDTLTAIFPDITMAGKDSTQMAFRLILNKSLTIVCPYKDYYHDYILIPQGDECDTHLPALKPDNPAPSPNALRQ